MKISKTSEFKNEIENIYYINLTAKECYLYSKYFYSPNNQKEREFLDSSLSIQFIRHILWRNCIIELSKLFSHRKTDQYNIYNFLNKIDKGGYYSKIYNPLENIKEWNLLILEKQNLIKNLITLRDKVYAHSSKNKTEYYALDFNFDSLKQLIDLIDAIIAKIFFEKFDSSLIIESYYYREPKIIEVLTDYDKIRREKVIEEFKSGRIPPFKY